MKLASALLACLAIERSAAAADCTDPFVRVEYDASIAKIERARIANELRADLAEKSIAICEESGGTPVARLAIAPISGGVSIRLEVHDAVTAKEVARSIDTSKVPPDGRALAIALAATELLRASWAELALKDAPPPAVPVPEPITRVVESTVAKPVAPPMRRIGLAVVFAGEAFSTGFARFGADVRGSVDATRRLSFALGGGFRRALSRSGPDGAIDADAIVIAAESAFELFPDRALGLAPFARFAVAPTTFHPTPASGASAQSATLVSVEMAGGVRGHWALTRTFFLTLELGAGGTIRSADAKDGDTVVASTSGAIFLGALGVQGRF